MLADFAPAQLIPGDRLIDWTPGVRVGVPGGIPNRTNIINVTAPPYSADNSGQADATAAIKAALAAAPEQAVVFLPAGTYRITQEIGLKDKITLRGAGMGATVLKFSGTLSSGLSSRAGSSGLYAPQSYPLITGGTTKGSTLLTTADTSSFTVGRLIQVSRFSSANQFESPLVVHVNGNQDGFGWIYKQKSKVVAKTATTLTIFPPLYGDMSGAAVRAVPGGYDRGGLGIENLTVDLTNSTTMFGVYLEEHIGSWVKGVRITGASNYSLHIADCLQCEVRECYLDELSHSGSNGAGLLMGATSGTLVENNIIRNSFPGMEINGGSCGNVFAYNFCKNDNGLVAIDTNHGPHNSYNLYEGNIATALMSDGYFGGESHGTIFRNWLTGIDTGSTPSEIGYGIALKRFTRQFSLVGNIYGAAGFSIPFGLVSLGQPNMGNGSSDGTAPPWRDWGTSPGPGGFQERDLGVEATVIQKGNYSYKDKLMEPLGGDALVESLYLPGRPAWFGNLTWPPVNPLSPGTPTPNEIYQKIPAGYRFVTGTNPPGVSGGGTVPSPTPTPTPAATPTTPAVPPPILTPTPNVSPTPAPGSSFNETNVQDLRITAVSGTSVNLAWNPLPGAIGYIVYYGTSAQSPEKSSAVGTSTSASITGLPSGGTTYFHVEAFDRAGVLNQRSNQVSSNQVSSNGSVVQDLRITAASGTSVNLAWNPLPGAIGYIVYYGTSAQSPEKSSAVGTSTSTSITGLPSGGTTYFHVEAFDRAGVLNQRSNQVSYSPGN